MILHNLSDNLKLSLIKKKVKTDKGKDLIIAEVVSGFLLSLQTMAVEQEITCEDMRIYLRDQKGSNAKSEKAVLPKSGAT